MTYFFFFFKGELSLARGQAYEGMAAGAALPTL